MSARASAATSWPGGLAWRRYHSCSPGVAAAECAAVTELLDRKDRRHGSELAIAARRKEISDLNIDLIKKEANLVKYAIGYPICNKELCKQRRLGIGEATPEVIEDFSDITFERLNPDTYLLLKS